MLGDFLKSEMHRKWKAGVHDCTTFPGDWSLTWGRGDPMAEWRGLYSTDEEARCLMARAGALVNLWQRGLDAIGVDAVNDPAEGDIGVILAVSATMEPEQIGAIWTGRRWAFRIESGIAFSSAVVVRCWGPR